MNVTIVGAGFGGLSAANILKHLDFEVLIIDKTNHHLFQPLLYQVATAGLSPGDIAVPVRSVFRDNPSVKVVMDTVTGFNLSAGEVLTSSGRYSFDYLLLAPGARHAYFGNTEWEQYAPGLKTLDDALIIREKILTSLELAERSGNAAERKKLLTFVIVGAGPTGVEMAGAIAEITKRRDIKEFRNIKPEDTRVILVEAAPRALTAYSPELSSAAAASLNVMGVEVFCGTRVTAVTADAVTLNGMRIETTNVIWAAGNQASPLLKELAVPLDSAGRVVVSGFLTIPGFENVFVIGDAARLNTQDGSPLPGTAPVAMQQGRYVAEVIASGKPLHLRQEFVYKDKGSMATIGRAKAVAAVFGREFSGFTAWFLWSFIHILYLIGFRNRFRVMAEWIWYYISYRHSFRLITGRDKG